MQKWRNEDGLCFGVWPVFSRLGETEIHHDLNRVHA